VNAGRDQGPEIKMKGPPDHCGGEATAKRPAHLVPTKKINQTFRIQAHEPFLDLPGAIARRGRTEHPFPGIILFNP
jgi:hypothetical protein